MIQKKTTRSLIFCWVLFLLIFAGGTFWYATAHLSPRSPVKLEKTYCLPTMDSPFPARQEEVKPPPLRSANIAFLLSPLAPGFLWQPAETIKQCGNRISHFLSQAEDRPFGTVCTLPSLRQPVHELDPHWLPLIDRLVQDGFERSLITELFSQLGADSYTPAYMAQKIEELHGARGIGLPRNTGEETQLPEGYELPIADMSAQGCYQFLHYYKKDLDTIEKKYGIPSSVVVSILFIETGLGTNLGKDPALRVLASMAATSTPALLSSTGNVRQTTRVPSQALQETLRLKSFWAYNELKSLLNYGLENNLNLATLPGSMYGAIGLCQFMPSNIAPYAADGNSDGLIDLFCIEDAMHSVAKFLEAHGWRYATSHEGKLATLMHYNQDSWYARQVLAVAGQIALAEQGKLAKGRNPLALTGSRQKRLDPAVRKQRFVPRAARIKGLSGYKELQ